MALILRHRVATQAVSPGQKQIEPDRVGRARDKKNRRRPTLPGGCPPSTIGAERLNCSVRNGKRCLPFAMHHRNFARRSVELENCTCRAGVKKSKHPSSPRTISTSRLHPLLDFYRWPINLVVYQGSYSL